MITAYEYQTHALRLAKKPQKDVMYQWKFHGEVSPCKVVSIRAVPGHYGQLEPKYGNRLMVQAVARFETLQVCLVNGSDLAIIDIFNRRGRVCRSTTKWANC